MIGLLLALHGPASASPLHGCSFFDERLVAQSWPGGLHTGCANFSVKQFACTKKKVTPLGVITYPGDEIRGRLPTYFIEVTPQLGASIFAQDIDGVALKLQLELAEAHWSKVTSGIPLPSDPLVLPTLRQGHSELDPGHPYTQFLHARALLVPYGAETWVFPSIGVAAGALAPTCFHALSEMTAQTWSDQLGHPDTIPTSLFAASAELVCRLPATSLVNDFDFPVGIPKAPFDPDLCAVPIPPFLALAGSMEPTSEVAKGALNPFRQCMGRFGPLLPRTGYVDTSDPLSAAHTVAYRMASLGADHFQTGPGVKAGDRWQVVWPPAANPAEAACHIPGAERPLELGGAVPLFTPTLPFTDGAGMHPESDPAGLATVEGSSPYVFAVWREFEICGEPLQGALFTADLAVLYPAKKAVCSLVP